MITFSFRTTPEAVQTLKKQAQKRKTSCGALLREILKEISAKEEKNESQNHRTNDCPGDDIDLGGGL
jgi:translation initiation factor 2B subunit (eIF-2B alpha/beta/delta family)